MDTNVPAHSFSEIDIKAAKDVLACFLNAARSYRLYPPNHIITKKTVSRVKTSLDQFFKNNNELRFIVKANDFIFQGNTIQKGKPNNDNPAFLFFSDGIRWIEFHKGISLGEIVGIFDIINWYSRENNTSEGDIVTALWEKDFPNFRYKAEDVLWEEAPLVDFSLSPVDEEDTIEAEPPSEFEKKVTLFENIQKYKNNPLTDLTHEEKETLQLMVVEHEMTNNDDDVLDILSIILENSKNTDDFASILNFQKKLLKNIISDGKFDHAADFLRNLHDIQFSYRRKKPWVADLIDHFRSEISRPSYLDVIYPHWKLLDTTNSGEKDIFVQFINLLPSESILSLMPMLNRIKSPRIQHRIMKIVLKIAKHDIEPLLQLLNHPDITLVQRVVHLMRYLKDEKSEEILRKLISHFSQRIRIEALKSLVSRKPEELVKMCLLIEDENPHIRKIMFNHLAKKRNKTVEKILLKYLTNENFKIDSQQHILACYKLLGKCGSNKSIPFLRRKLLDQPFRLNRSYFRQGAATALWELNNDKATGVLNKAYRSFFPVIRKAHHRAFQHYE